MSIINLGGLISSAKSKIQKLSTQPRTLASNLEISEASWLLEQLKIILPHDNDCKLEESKFIDKLTTLLSDYADRSANTNAVLTANNTHAVYPICVEIANYLVKHNLAKPLICYLIPTLVINADTQDLLEQASKLDQDGNLGLYHFILSDDGRYLIHVEDVFEQVYRSDSDIFKYTIPPRQFTLAQLQIVLYDKVSATWLKDKKFSIDSASPALLEKINLAFSANKHKSSFDIVEEALVSEHFTRREAISIAAALSSQHKPLSRTEIARCAAHTPYSKLYYESLTSYLHVAFHGPTVGACFKLIFLTLKEGSIHGDGTEEKAGERAYEAVIIFLLLLDKLKQQSPENHAKLLTFKSSSCRKRTIEKIEKDLHGSRKDTPDVIHCVGEIYEELQDIYSQHLSTLHSWPVDFSNTHLEAVIDNRLRQEDIYAIKQTVEHYRSSEKPAIKAVNNDSYGNQGEGKRIKYLLQEYDTEQVQQFLHDHIEDAPLFLVICRTILSLSSDHLQKCRCAIMAIKDNHSESISKTLQLSVAQQQFSIADFILEFENIKTNYQDENGYSTLHYASLFNQANLVKKLLENNANADLASKISQPGDIFNNFTPLMIALYKEHQDIVSILAHKQPISEDNAICVIDTVIMQHQRGILNDVEENNCLRELLVICEGQVINDIFSNYMRNCLATLNLLARIILTLPHKEQQRYLNILNNHKKNIEITLSVKLIQCIKDKFNSLGILLLKAEVVSADHKHCDTSLLHTATEYNNLEMAKILCDKDPSIINLATYYKCIGKCTAFMIALINGHVGLVEELMKRGAEFTLIDAISIIDTVFLNYSEREITQDQLVDRLYGVFFCCKEDFLEGILSNYVNNKLTRLKSIIFIVTSLRSEEKQKWISATFQICVKNPHHIKQFVNAGISHEDLITDMIKSNNIEKAVLEELVHSDADANTIMEYIDKQNLDEDTAHKISKIVRDRQLQLQLQRFCNAFSWWKFWQNTERKQQAQSLLHILNGHSNSKEALRDIIFYTLLSIQAQRARSFFNFWCDTLALLLHSYLNTSASDAVDESESLLLDALNPIERRFYKPVVFDADNLQKCKHIGSDSLFARNAQPPVTRTLHSCISTTITPGMAQSPQGQG